MKSCLVIMVLLVIGKNAICQTCPTCDSFLSTIYDRISIEKSEDFRSAFKTWFFSDSFESQVKKNETGLDITVPFEGVPVTFGGTNESQNAWVKWTNNKGSTKWDFSNITKEKIFTEVATTESRDIWLQCVKTTCSNLSFNVEARSDDKSALYTISYNPKIFDVAPIYHSFESIGGLDVSKANKFYKGKKMKKAGEAISFPWKSDEDTQGGIIVNTNKGASFITMVERKVFSNEAAVSYINLVTGDLNNNDELTKVGTITEDRIVPGMNETECQAGCEACSPDGKFCARVTTLEFKAAPEQTLKHFKIIPVNEGGYTNAWTFELPSRQTEGSQVFIKVANFGPVAKYRIAADIYKAKTTLRKLTSKCELEDNNIKFSLPKEAFFPLVVISFKNKKVMNFEPEGKLPKGIIKVAKSDIDNETQYIFKVQ